MDIDNWKATIIVIKIILLFELVLHFQIIINYSFYTQNYSVKCTTILVIIIIININVNDWYPVTYKYHELIN